MSVTTSARGAAVEHYVITQALQHRFRVAVPVVDLGGVDLYIVNTRGELVTVQVKTAKRHRESWRLKLTSSTEHRYSVDVLVAVTPTYSKLWVVPGVVIASLRYNTTRHDRWLDRWDALESVGAFRGRTP